MFTRSTVGKGVLLMFYTYVHSASRYPNDQSHKSSNLVYSTTHWHRLLETFANANSTMTTSLPPGTNFQENYFQHPELTKIVGEPTHTSLTILINELKANAQSVHSNLGGGVYGHLGLVLSPVDYDLLHRPLMSDHNSQDPLSYQTISLMFKPRCYANNTQKISVNSKK